MRETPDKVAYFCGDQQRTWKEMNATASLLACGMERLGVHKGDVAAILGRESFVIYEHFFACMKLGVVRVGVNWRYPPQEVLNVLRDSGARLLFVERHCAQIVREIMPDITTLGIEVVGYGGDHGFPVDLESLVCVECQEVASRPEIQGDDPLFYSFTSGTTGKPKGVVISHRGFMHSISCSVKGRGLRSDDIWYMAGQSSWIVVIMAMYGLENGCSHVIPDGAFSVRGYLRDIELRRVTAASLMPSMISCVIEEIKQGGYDLSSLRLLTFGSAPVPPKHLLEVRQILHCELMQSYGLTEAGGWVTYLTPKDHEHALAQEQTLLKSAGRAGSGYKISIRDEQGKELPPGEVGEVWVLGRSTMIGYLNQPDLSAEVLHDGWLRTNDIGRLDARGYLFLLDRRNALIISGGVNVYPAGVEAVLMMHPAVAEAVVVGVPDAKWGEMVQAAVSLHPDEVSVVENDLVSHCARYLSKPECPKRIVLYDKLPKTDSGKMNRRKVAEILSSVSQFT